MTMKNNAPAVHPDTILKRLPLSIRKRAAEFIIPEADIMIVIHSPITIEVVSEKTENS